MGYVIITSLIIVSKCLSAFLNTCVWQKMSHQTRQLLTDQIYWLRPGRNRKSSSILNHKILAVIPQQQPLYSRPVPGEEVFYLFYARKRGTILLGDKIDPPFRKEERKTRFFDPSFQCPYGKGSPRGTSLLIIPYVGTYLRMQKNS